MQYNEQIKLPKHFVSLMCENGHSKDIALFASLKKLYSSGHIHNYKSVDLNVLHICRKTYYKRLRVLQRMQLIIADGKGGFNIIGQDKLLELYPCKQRLKYIRLDNTKELRSELEKVAYEYNIINQDGMIDMAIRNNVDAQKQNTALNVCVQPSASITPPLEYETSVSCKKHAHLLGFKSKMTGWRRRRKYEDSGFVKYTKRPLISLGKLTDDKRKEYQSLGWVMFRNSTGNWYRKVAYTVAILKGDIGKRIIPQKQEGVITFCNNPIFNENW